MLNNIVDNCEECGQHNIVQSCHTTGSEFLRCKMNRVSGGLPNKNLATFSKAKFSRLDLFSKTQNNQLTM